MTLQTDAPQGPVPPQNAAPQQAPCDPDRAEKTKKKRKRRAIWISSTLAATIALGSTAYWAADRFLIPHVGVGDVAAYEAENQTVSSSDDSTGTYDGDTYTNRNTSVTVSQKTTGSGDDTVTCYVADVTLGDATDLQSAFANNQFGENITEKTGDMAADHDAAFAINGDYYGFRDTGIEIRNGVVYRDEGAREGLAFYTDGTAKVYDETETTGDELVDDGVWNTLSFGPALIENGKVVDGIDDVEVDTNFGNHSIQGEQPRTAVGVIDENHLVFVVVDGRETGYSRGATMTELASIMKDLGAKTAYNIDGGGSSTMYFNGEVINRPSNGGERGTSDILYVA